MALQDSPSIKPPDQGKNNNSPWDWFGFTLEIPEFDGGSKPEDVLDWLATVDSILEFRNLTDDNRRVSLSLVTSRLRGRALAWWKLNRTNKSVSSNWENLKNQMRNAFVPVNYQRKLYQRFHNLKQGSKSVDDYADEFFGIQVRIENIHDSEEQLAIRFISGLRPDLQYMVNQFDPITVQQARYQANLIEQQTQHKSLCLLRTKMFQSTCMINGEVVSFHIDSGSCTNLISENIVRYLALRIEPHPNPYNIGWLYNSGGIRIYNRVLLKFSIGSIYEDQIYCDVVSMDVSHLILGRPWQFDRHVVHNGFTNTHTFEFQGKVITLVPNKESASNTFVMQHHLS